MVRIPRVKKCCICVTDLKSAAAIIAVLGIVTSPVVSWAVVKHSYVIRVSCYVTTSQTRRDILDINLNHVLSFGLGSNAGLEPSCLGQPVQDTGLTDFNSLSDAEYPKTYLTIVHYYGWFVLVVDLSFLIVSIVFLTQIFQATSVKKLAMLFMCTAGMSTFLSFIYGMMYVCACLIVGGAFPIFEFAFCGIDLLVWGYFILVIYSYREDSPGT